MPRRTMFGYEDILKGAYSVLERDGLPAVTAVSVAEEVGSSTMPIFWLFRTINDLRNEVIKIALENLAEEMKKPRGNNLLSDAGMAMSILARDKPNVFKALFFEQPLSSELMNIFTKWLYERVRSDKAFSSSSIPDATRYQKLMNDLFTILLGHASRMVLGSEKPLKDEFLLKSLTDLITPYYNEHVENKGKHLSHNEDLKKQVQKHAADFKNKKDDSKPVFPSFRKSPVKKATRKPAEQKAAKPQSKKSKVQTKKLAHGKNGSKKSKR